MGFSELRYWRIRSRNMWCQFCKTCSSHKWWEISGQIALELCHRVRFCKPSNIIAEATTGLNFSLDVFDALKSIDTACFLIRRPFVVVPSVVRDCVLGIVAQRDEENYTISSILSFRFQIFTQSLTLYAPTSSTICFRLALYLIFILI